MLAKVAKYTTVHTGYKGLSVTGEWILYMDAQSNEQFIPGQSLISALGQRSRTDMVLQLQDTAPFVRVLGDAAKVASITNAVYGGYHAALDI